MRKKVGKCKDSPVCLFHQQQEEEQVPCGKSEPHHGLVQFDEVPCLCYKGTLDTRHAIQCTCPERRKAKLKL